jgi:hypothetical protein
MQALLGWSLLGSWIAIGWALWRFAVDARDIVRDHRKLSGN